MAKVLALFIKGYQKASRFLLPHTCRFYPSCSCYALQAIEKHGAAKGLFKALVRISKCSPLFPGGYDPVK
jgi:putative membrane protein insertion efficiency factor